MHTEEVADREHILDSIPPQYNLRIHRLLFGRYGEVEDVEAILSSGVGADHQDKHGNTALHLSCANGHPDVVRALIKAGATHLPNAAGNRYL